MPYAFAHLATNQSALKLHNYTKQQQQQQLHHKPSSQTTLAEKLHHETNAKCHTVTDVQDGTGTSMLMLTWWILAPLTTSILLTSH